MAKVKAGASPDLAGRRLHGPSARRLGKQGTQAIGPARLDAIQITTPMPRFTLLIALALVAGCTEAGPTDRTGPTASTPADSADATRVVTIGGPITEIVYALGQGGRVVGTDRSSLFPEAILAGPRLDYFRQTSAEGVLALRPTLVLAVDGTGPPGVLDQIRAAGVAVLVLPEATDVAGAEARIARIGQVLGREAQADSVVAVMRAELAAAEAAKPATPPRVLFVYARGAGVVLAAGTGGAPEGILRLAGAETAVTAYEGYRPLTAEAVVAAAPDVIVVPAGSLESLGGIDGLLRQPGLSQTPAGRARRIVTVDDALLLGFGPRVGQGVRDLALGLAGTGA